MHLRIPPPTFELLRAEILEASEGRARCRFVASESMTNPIGVVQGGILAAMLDDTMGPAMMAYGRPFTTVDLHVNYLGSAHAEEPLVGEAEVVKVGRSQAYVEAGLRRESDGRLVARASQVALFLDEKT